MGWSFIVTCGGSSGLSAGGTKHFCSLKGGARNVKRAVNFWGDNSQQFIIFCEAQKLYIWRGTQLYTWVIGVLMGGARKHCAPE